MYIRKALLLCSVTSSVAFMFQGNNLLHRTVALNMSSVQTLAPKVREQTKPVYNRAAEVSAHHALLSRSKRIMKTVPSGQVQTPIHIRIIKAVWEESLPWIVSFIVPSLISVVHRDFGFLHSYIIIEFSFFLACTIKMVKLNEPITPEPLLGRSWEETAYRVWNSLETIDDKKTYLMGWFYDADFEDLREEDALSFVAWMRYGLPLEEGILTEEEMKSLRNFDLPLLIRNVNRNIPLPTRSSQEKPLSHIRFNCEPLRYRHKGILFYAVTHGIDLILSSVLRKNGYKYHPSTKEDLAFWYRPSQSPKKSYKDPIVFVHGVGGMAFTWKLIEELQAATWEQDVPIILIDLPHVSLRFHDNIPTIEEQIISIAKMIEKVTLATDKSPRATFVGHSFGTTIISWMVQKRPDLVSGCVFLDPICFQLHLKSTLFNFHMQRVDYERQRDCPWVNPFSLGSVINMAGTEMHTNYAMLRQFSWASNSLWPIDLAEIPSYVILSENDDIVPVKDVEKVFNQTNNRRQGKLTKTHVFEGACHGEMFLNDEMRSITVQKVLNIMESSC